MITCSNRHEIVMRGLLVCATAMFSFQRNCFDEIGYWFVHLQYIQITSSYKEKASDEQIVFRRMRTTLKSISIEFNRSFSSGRLHLIEKGWKTDIKNESPEKYSYNVRLTVSKSLQFTSTERMVKRLTREQAKQVRKRQGTISYFKSRFEFQLFHQFDDGDGLLSMDQVCNAVKKWCPVFDQNPAAIRRACRSADLNQVSLSRSTSVVRLTFV